MWLAYIGDSVNDSAFSFSQRTFVICPFSVFTSVYMQQIDLHSFFRKLTSVIIMSFTLHSSLLRPLVFMWYLTKLDCSTSNALKSFLLLSVSIFLSESLSLSSTCSDSMPRGFNPWCKYHLFHSLVSKCLAHNIPIQQIQIQWMVITHSHDSALVEKTSCGLCIIRLHTECRLSMHVSHGLGGVYWVLPDY